MAPGQRADQGAVFWRPEACASVVLLTEAPDDQAGLLLGPDTWAKDVGVVRRDAADGVHLMIAGPRGRFQLRRPPEPDRDLPLAAILLLDPAAPLRAEATLRFWRFATQDLQLPSMSSRLPSEQLRPTLRALDARQDGASYRAVAEALFGAGRVERQSWKTSSLRGQAIRLVQRGLSLMQGGYRRLLRRERR